MKQTVGNHDGLDIGDLVVVTDREHEAFGHTFLVFRCNYSGSISCVRYPSDEDCGRIWNFGTDQVQRAVPANPTTTMTVVTVPLTGQYIFWRWRNDPEAKCRPVSRAFVERQEGKVVLLSGLNCGHDIGGPPKAFVDLDTIDIIGVDSVK